MIHTFFRIVDTVARRVIRDVEYDILMEGYPSAQSAIDDYNRTYSIPFSEMQRCHGYAVESYQEEI